MHVTNLSRHVLPAAAVASLEAAGYSVDPAPLSPSFRDRDDTAVIVCAANAAGELPVLVAGADGYLAAAAAGGQFILLTNVPDARQKGQFVLARITLVDSNTAQLYGLTDIPLVEGDRSGEDLPPVKAAEVKAALG
jgi:hypothetical protein